MKFYSILVASIYLLLFLSATAAVAQENQSAEWIRVQSDNGEFSIEVPAKYTFIVDKTGCLLSGGSDIFSLEEMKMLNSFQEKTLISFESYKASKKALNAIRENDGGNGKSSEIQRDNFTIKQISIKTDKSYTVRQYINSKNYIYILTAASRNGETAAMKRFLSSLVFKSPDSATSGTAPVAGAIPFSALKTSQIELDENPAPHKKPDKSHTSQSTAEDIESVIIVNKPSAAYTNEALASYEAGIVEVRLTFSKEGNISKIGFLKTLKYGLARQAFFAALRIKFLPSEKDGKSQTVSKIVEYEYLRH